MRHSKGVIKLQITVLATHISKFPIYVKMRNMEKLNPVKLKHFCF